MRMKRTIKILLIVILGITSLSNCTSLIENDDPSVEEIVLNSNFTLMTNSWDPLITRYKDEEEQIDYWGERDVDGMPTVINQINVHKEGGITVFRLDEEGRPKDVLAQNGTLIKFDWVSDQKASLTLISADGLEQINTEIDLSENAGKSVVNSLKPQSRIGKSSSLNFREVTKTFQSLSNTSLATPMNLQALRIRNLSSSMVRCTS